MEPPNVYSAVNVKSILKLILAWGYVVMFLGFIEPGLLFLILIYSLIFWLLYNVT